MANHATQADEGHMGILSGRSEVRPLQQIERGTVGVRFNVGSIDLEYRGVPQLVPLPVSMSDFPYFIRPIQPEDVVSFGL